VQLNIVKARAQATAGLPAGFLGPWCCVAVEVAYGFHRVVAVGTGETTFGCMAEVVEVVGCLGDGGAQTEALSSILGCEESQRCTGAPQVLLFLCLCVASRLQHDELLQLLLFCRFIFEGFFLPVLHLDLYWQWCPRGRLMRGASISLD
jgi:hypothetical protein